MSFEEQIMSKDKYVKAYFWPNGGYCVHIGNFENWRISLRYSPVLVGEYPVM